MKVWILIMWFGHGAFTIPNLPNEEECLRLKTELSSYYGESRANRCIQYHIKGLTAP